jgi:hypothetical protein
MTPIISADSHITEAPGTYLDRIDHRFKDRAPRIVHDPVRGDLFVIAGLDKPIPWGWSPRRQERRAAGDVQRALRGHAPRRLGSRGPDCTTRTATACTARSSTRPSA